MVVAMHHIQVACLVRHGRNEVLQAYLRELAEHQYLLASATTEVGTGGDVRSSICALEVDRRPVPGGEAGSGDLLRRRRRRRAGDGPARRPTAPRATR